ncbi:MAB_1171c family putative transporter [Streptomyces sp. NPDC006733]|uniref:MAB_1171c family putative transporter n=1 Tax=Streptomyces sp. NPDC006733 TaxID=3155460 RepID=UPI00340B0627
MTDAIAYAIIALLLFQAVWRIPAALRGQSRERSLWGAFAALAVAWLLRTDLGRAVIDGLGVVDLATLLKHVITIAGICVLLRYVTAVDGDGAASDPAVLRRVRVTAAVHRIATRASLATVLVMAAVFFLVLDRTHTESPYFMARHAGEVGLALYMGLFYLYTAVAAAVCAYQWGGSARRARRWTLRTGLTMMAVAMALAVLYAVVRTAYCALITVRTVSAHVISVQENITDTMLYLVFLLWAVGAIAPATQALVDRRRAKRALTALYPLWRELALAVPSVILRAPSNVLPGHGFSAPLNRARDLMRLSPPPSLRLERYVTEISDVQRTLSHYASPGLYERATALADRQGHPEDAARAVADAYWIRSALAAMAAGSAAHSAPVDVPPADDDFDVQVERYVRTRAAFGRTDPDTARALLQSNVTV